MSPDYQGAALIDGPLRVAEGAWLDWVMPT